MKKNNIISFVLGAVLFGSMGAFAGQYTAIDNPFPVQLNGEQVQIQGYNIEGSTYFKLRDIADAVGGFEVDFNNDIIQLSQDDYIYVNEIKLDENMCGKATYDLDFDGLSDTIEIIQKRSYDNSEDGSFNALKTELIVNGTSLIIDNAYKTHGCGRAFVTDIDTTDNALDIILLMSYKYTGAHIYQYANGEIIPSTTTETVLIDENTEGLSESFNIGEMGVTPDMITVTVNNSNLEDKGINFFIKENEEMNIQAENFYYKKIAQNLYEYIVSVG